MKCVLYKCTFETFLHLLCFYQTIFFSIKRFSFFNMYGAIALSIVIKLKQIVNA